MPQLQAHAVESEYQQKLLPLPLTASTKLPMATFEKLDILLSKAFKQHLAPFANWPLFLLKLATHAQGRCLPVFLKILLRQPKTLSKTSDMTKRFKA
jgi:hypothetical protein